MDVAYFLHDRTMQIRHFFDTASAPFIESKRAIDVGDPPFHEPPYDKSGEPPFLGEWLQADTSQQLVGRAAVSMLSEALKQFFLDWEFKLDRTRPCPKDFKGVLKNRGFLLGYVTCFAEALGITPEDFPVDLGMIEQVVIARNTVQHMSVLWPQAIHDNKNRELYPRPFFAREGEAWAEDGSMPFLNPSLHIDRDKLFAACDEVDKLGAWLQAEIYARFASNAAKRRGEP
jgi:hypothetical protein